MSQKRRLRSTPNLTSVYANLIPFPMAPIRSHQLEARSRRLGLCSRRRSLPRGRPLIPRAPKSRPQRLQSPLPASCSSTCHLLADWLSWCRLPVSSADRACSPSTALLPRLSNFTCSPSSSSRSRTSDLGSPSHLARVALTSGSPFLFLVFKQQPSPPALSFSSSSSSSWLLPSSATGMYT